MKTLAIGTSILAMVLVCSSRAEEQCTTLPRYVYHGCFREEQLWLSGGRSAPETTAAIFLSNKPRYVGLRTGDKERDTSARVDVQVERTSTIEE
ncbi:hypothetical protein SAMN03159463_02636 [Mesorhizobium sp. NFR06]|nr:hypothetical protein SAMN03159463_02636 [Mesorhizobium sp. NFR06]